MPASLVFSDHLLIFVNCKVVSQEEDYCALYRALDAFDAQSGAYVTRVLLALYVLMHSLKCYLLLPHLATCNGMCVNRAIAE